MSLIAIIIAGIIACAAMDIWQRLLYFSARVPPSNWAIVGRWSYYCVTRGLIFNAGIDSMPPRTGELKLGWFVHYFVGIGYAVAYWLLEDSGSLTFSWQDGLLFGVLSSVVPWFFFLPALGKGVLAKNTPTPVKTCILALLTHAVFGTAMAVGFSLVLR